MYPDETSESATAFLEELVCFYGQHGVVVERVLTDNGACFKRRWAVACAAHGIAVKKTRAYRPQTNGKAECFIRTMLERWAYAYAYEHESARLGALPPALDFYNRFRPHRALGGLAPLQRVNNLPGTFIEIKRGSLRGAFSARAQAFPVRPVGRSGQHPAWSPWRDRQTSGTRPEEGISWKGLPAPSSARG